jgi:hypothetical protein
MAKKSRVGRLTLPDAQELRCHASPRPLVDAVLIRAVYPSNVPRRRVLAFRRMARE